MNSIRALAAGLLPAVMLVSGAVQTAEIRSFENGAAESKREDVRMSGIKIMIVTFVSAFTLVSGAVVVMAADGPPPPQSAGPVAPSSRAASQPPMITKNPDGTFTVQKVPSKDSKDNNGLVIPPQVVVPFVQLPTTEKKHDATSLR
jgi:hypothetical protein